MKCLIVALVLLFAIPCYACTCTTVSACCKPIKGAQGEKGDNGEPKEIPLGVGTDVVVWENKAKNVDVEAQYRYDINNTGHSVFGVVRVNLWDIVTK